VNIQQKLESIQRKALMLAIGCTSSTPTMAIEAILNVKPVDITVKMTAYKGFLRLAKSGSWRQDGMRARHKRIESLMSIKLDSDTGEMKWNLDKRFEIVINEKNNWNYDFMIRNNPYCWYTDGSKILEKVGIGICNPVKDIEIKKRLSDYCNIYQAETIAIKECANTCIDLGLLRKHIIILTDSRSTLMSLNKGQSNSKTVNECITSLNELSRHNSVKLGWCPSHNEVTGNELADKLAKEGTKLERIDIITPAGEKLLEKWGRAQAIKRWRECKTPMKHSRKFINPFESNTAKLLHKFNRHDLRIIFSVLTGHACTRSFLHNIKKSTLKNCRFCDTDTDETIMHLIENCEKLEFIRLQTLGTAKPNAEEIKSCKLIDVLKFIKKSNIDKLIINPTAE
jgi:hypothetical protein